ncbi:MAG: ABC transporter permease [Vulcanimicrobiaceae bacterium]
MIDAAITPAVEEAELPRRHGRRFGGVASASLLWLAFVVLACALGPLAIHANPNATDVAAAFAPPSAQHWLGTDDLGRDELLRVLVGGRVTIAVGAVAAAVAMVIGSVYGALCGYYGGWIDALLMRAVDVFMSVPTLFLLLFLAAIFHGNIATLMLVIGVTSWLGPARLVRGEILTLKERLYVEAARSIGATDARIIFRHLIPNAFGTIVTTTTFMVASAMLAETALSYLGIGVRAPTPSWGNLLSGAQSDIFARAYWLILPPGLAILLTVAAFNFAGDAIRERSSGQHAAGSM